jgi:hypothetical protein
LRRRGIGEKVGVDKQDKVLEGIVFFGKMTWVLFVDNDDDLERRGWKTYQRLSLSKLMLVSPSLAGIDMS